MDLDSEIQSSNKIDTAIPRQLVLDYLLHNCYGETARAFMKDDLDAVKDSSDSAANGRKNGSGASATNGASSAVAVSQGGAMTRNTSESNNNINNIDNGDIHHRRARHPASLMMDTEKEELDQEGDSPMGESYLDTRDSLSTSTFTADKAHALHIDEQLKNLETRKGTHTRTHIRTTTARIITTTTTTTTSFVINNKKKHYTIKQEKRKRRMDKCSRIRGIEEAGERNNRRDGRGKHAKPMYLCLST